MMAAARVDDEKKRQRAKNRALLGVLVAVIALLYFITIARMGMLP